MESLWFARTLAPKVKPHPDRLDLEPDTPELERSGRDETAWN